VDPTSAGQQESSAGSNLADCQIVGLWWYTATIGVIAGAAIVGTAFLPQQIAGPCPVAAALLMGVFNRIAEKSSGTRLSIPASPVGVGYLVALAVVLFGSLIVAWTVVRHGGPSWLAWMLAAVVFVVVLSGTWVAKTRRAT
jgi:hypothetical protein